MNWFFEIPDGIRKANPLKEMMLNMANDEQRRRRRVPRHPYWDYLLPYLGVVEEPETYEEEVMEYIESKLTFDGVPNFSFAEGARLCAGLLQVYGFDPQSSNGRRLLGTYVDHAKDEHYGDLNSFAECWECGEVFRVDFSLDYVNLVLAGQDLCPACLQPQHDPIADDLEEFQVIAEQDEQDDPAEEGEVDPIAESHAAANADGSAHPLVSSEEADEYFRRLLEVPTSSEEANRQLRRLLEE